MTVNPVIKKLRNAQELCRVAGQRGFTRRVCGEVSLVALGGGQRFSREDLEEVNCGDERPRNVGDALRERNLVLSAEERLFPEAVEVINEEKGAVGIYFQARILDGRVHDFAVVGLRDLPAQTKRKYRGQGKDCIVVDIARKDVVDVVSRGELWEHIGTYKEISQKISCFVVRRKQVKR
ncbi:hypothetical protein KKA02_01725 [Patescibacteria group bacterium]|nr:hypothetical protein [Patescibacteria group bacterium]